jgi:hypothetical protein
MAELTNAPATRRHQRAIDRLRPGDRRRRVLLPACTPIAATLGRIASITSAPALTDPLKIRVLPDGLLLDERTPARADSALSELAALLHSHLIGELTIQPGGDVEAWRNFLLLLGRSPESVRIDGGIARVWTTMGGRHVELREIDYAEVLQAFGWRSVVCA